MNKILRLLFVTILFLIPSVCAEASCNIVIDGETLICRDSAGTVVSPFVENGTTYVPVRAISESFQVPVSWDMDTKTVFLGEKGGTPTLEEFVNIYYNGTPFFCRDVNGEIVHPILRDGATYLPLRGIGELLGKTVSWDNMNKNAVLTTPATEEAVSHFKNALTNTTKEKTLTQNLAFIGKLFLNDNIIKENNISETVDYTAKAFTLISILPEGYEKTLVYKGNGNYFIYADPSAFTRTSYIHLSQQNLPEKMNFSPLYINVFVKNGYVRSVKADTTYTLSVNSLEFIGKISISSEIIYPLDFKFPNIPNPDSNNGDSVFSQDVLDASEISSLTEKYIACAIKGDSKSIASMLSNPDYLSIFGRKTENQISVQYTKMASSLSKVFRHATGEYEITSMSYTNPETLKPTPEKAAVIKVEIACVNKDEAWTEEIELSFVKVDSSWHIASWVVQNLF